VTFVKCSELIKGLTRKIEIEANISPYELDQLSDVMHRYIDLLLQLEMNKEANIMLDAVDFPEFVADLINGVFQAIVDSSIQQMEAFAELLQEISKSVDRFRQDNEQDDKARDYLASGVLEEYFDIDEFRKITDITDCKKLKRVLSKLGIDLAIDCPPTEEQLQAVHKAIEVRSRQKHLSTMVMMGINRIIVDDGEIKAH
jgi:hypothetical protein